MSMIFVICLLSLPLTVASNGPHCVEGAAQWACNGDWTWHVSGKCCLKRGGWATCEGVDSPSFCQAPFQYLGTNQLCCTDQYVHCEVTSYVFCCGSSCKDGDWKYLGSNKCCLTGESQPQVTCKKSSYSSCSAPRKYFDGDSKCCDITEQAYCNGYTQMGSQAYGTCTNKCQTTHGGQTYGYDWCLLSGASSRTKTDWCWCDAPSLLALASDKARISPQMLAICSMFVAGFSLIVMAWYVGHGGQRQPAEEPLLLA